MAGALPRRKARPCNAITINEHDRAAEEQRRAALAYLVWPAALYERFVEREPASSWYRQQIRQAVRFGANACLIALAALLWPLVLSLLFGNLTATLIFYGLAIALDIAFFGVWLQRGLRYSKRAARGETFALQPLRRPSTRSVAAKQ